MKHYELALPPRYGDAVPFRKFQAFPNMTVMDSSLWLFEEYRA